MLVVTRTIHIPEAELHERFTRADGPGGQYVNRTASAVELRFDAAASPSLPEAVRARLLSLHDQRITAGGTIVIRARRFRDQVRNRDDARQRLAQLIAKVVVPPRKRIATRPGRAARERRLTDKHQKSRRKQLRRARPDDT